jgi:hypothetical protein
MAQILHYKESPDLGQFLSESLHSSVIAIVYFMAMYSWARWHKVLTITEIWRENDPTGTHKNWRAVDIRNSNLSKQNAIELANKVNAIAQYDPTRPAMKCCLVYELDPTGNHDDHFHIQVHERTVFNADEL